MHRTRNRADRQRASRHHTTRHWMELVGITGLLGLSACSGGEAEGPTPDATPTANPTPVPASPTPETAPVVPEGCDVAVHPSADDQTAVQEALITSGVGATVCLVDGPFSLIAELGIDSKDLTLKGINNPVLDFSGQIAGGNGIHAISDGFTIEGLTVNNPAGDGIRATSVENVTFRAVAVLWDEPSEENGGYGLYPVGSTGVLIEDSAVSGASDAGVYVGQSSDIVVRGNEVYGNVAGIEIENSTNAEVMDNHCHDNTGGILVFNLPELPVKNGIRAKVYNNLIEHNNQESFAPEGNIVGLVPQGTGIMLLASDFNEIHDNIVKDNISVGIAVIHYDSDLIDDYEDAEFDAYPEGNYVHDNVFTNNGQDPQGIAAQLAIAKGLGVNATLPPILWDGCVDGNKDNSSGSLTNCFFNNLGEEGAAASYVNIELCEGLEAPPTYDISEVTCEHDPITFE